MWHILLIFGTGFDHAIINNAENKTVWVGVIFNKHYCTILVIFLAALDRSAMYMRGIIYI